MEDSAHRTAEHKPYEEPGGPASSIVARRRGFAAVLFGLVRPGHAKAATLNASALSVTFAFRSKEIPLGDIETAELTVGWLWAGVRIRHACGESTVSGLSLANATALATALEAARVEWWRDALAERIELVRAVHGRVTQLVEAQRYFACSVFRDLEHNARNVAGEIASVWPDTLSTAPQIRMLKRVRSFVEDSDTLRARANEAFVEKELSR